jgi:DNA invertase Pin-like site-specific DNA recombinase
MTRDGFYGRVSTEDQQDPEASRAWQIDRATGLIKPAGGEIVTEYFDVGHSRYLPWERRPQAAALLQALKNPNRGFSAVVIGEPHRAFYGNQFSLIFPLFVHYGVELWVPEIGGPIDPRSDVHDLIMTIFGGMSKGERNRIRIRVSSSMTTQARNGSRFLGGRPPHGYLLADAGPHPVPAKAAAGQRLHILARNSETAPDVVRIFTEYDAGYGYKAIAEGLTADGIPCPSEYDPARNSHRHRKGWQPSTVRAILTNPVYTGRSVWNRSRREEVLVDVDNVALGYDTRMRKNDPSAWVYSEKFTHEPLIGQKLFERVELKIRSAGGSNDERSKRSDAERVYPFRDHLRCAICGRKMEGSVSNGHRRYRCTYRRQFKEINQIEHPTTLSVREDALMETVDNWLSKLFEPEHLDGTLTAMAAAQEPTAAETARRARAREQIAECDRKLELYRKTLESGGDPVAVARWTNEVRADRAAAELIQSTRSSSTGLSAEEMRTTLSAIGDIRAKLARATEVQRAALYKALGLSATYDHLEQVVHVEAAPLVVPEDPCGYGGVGGATRNQTLALTVPLTWSFVSEIACG